MTSKPATKLAAAATIAVLLAITRACLAPSDVVPADAPATEFSGARAMKTLVELIGERDEPHPVGSEAHDAVAIGIFAALDRLGLHPERETRTSCAPVGACARITNVFARLPGRAADHPIVATAHYDSVPISPGAADDAAGCATLLEIAAALAAGPQPLHPVDFVFSDGEELGLLGARAYADRDPAAIAKTTVVNVESRGTSGPSLMFQTSRANHRVVRALATAPHPIASSVFPTFYELLPNDTDLTVYLQHDTAGVNFAFVGDVTFYHSARDNLAELDPRTVQHQGETALATVRALADTDDDADDPGARLIYFDVLGRFVVSWPVAVAQLGALALVVLLALAIRATPAPRAAAGWPRAIARAVGTVLAPPLLGIAIARVAHLAGAVGWVAHPAPYLAATLLATLAVVAASAAPVDPARWLATLGAWVALAIALAFALPGMSYPVMLPAAVGCIATIATPRRDVARLVASIVAALVWFPLAWLVLDALGLDGLVVIAACATPPLACWLGALDDRRLARRVAIAAGGVAVACIVVGAVLPTYSAAVPQRLSAQRVHDVTAGKAWWVLRFAGDLPAFLPAAIRTGASAARLFPWELHDAQVAPAPVVPVAAPELAGATTTATPTGRRITATLVAHRASRGLRLAFTPDVAIDSLRLDGVAVAPIVWNGWQLVGYDGAPVDGVAVELVTRTTTPVTVRIIDVASAPLFAADALGPPPDDVVPTGADDVIVTTQTL